MANHYRKVKKFLNQIWLSLILVFTFLIITNLPFLIDYFQAIAQPIRSEIRGVWITNNDFNILKDRVKLQGALTKLKQLNFNTIYPVVWNAGYAMFPSVTAQKAGSQPFQFRGTNGQDIVADVVAQGHSQGLLVIPWFEFGFMAPPTSELATNRRSWLTEKRDRKLSSVNEEGEVVWLNPFRPDVQEFITNLVLEVVTNYDVDGIQFDDHMSLPNEFGYDDFTMNLYRKDSVLKNQACLARRQKVSKKQPPKPQLKSQSKPKIPSQLVTGLLAIDEPIILQPAPTIFIPPKIEPCNLIPTEPSSNPDDPTWVKWRADKITEFMVRLNKAVKQVKPRAIFSVSPNYYDFAYKEQLQDWRGWVRQNIVDELIVQVYRSNLQSFVDIINRPEMEETRQKTLTGVAILSGLRNNPASLRQIQSQVQATRERNLGVSFFYFNSLWGYGPESAEERQAQIRNFFSASTYNPQIYNRSPINNNRPVNNPPLNNSGKNPFIN